MPGTAFLIAVAAAILSTAAWAGDAARTADGDATGREALFNTTEAAQVSQRLHADPRAARILAACPADVFAAERPFWRGLSAPRRPSEHTCAQHPADCYDLCLAWANGPACFDLALAYDHHSLDVPDELDQMRFHALACAMGFPSGCTNRAAGIRNGGYAADPFRDAPLPAKQACEHRSFLIDCDRRGAWGCAMLGQTYRNGEGVAVQPQRARAAFAASCEINPKFAACDFAKRQLERMDAARPSETGNGRLGD